MELTCDDIQAQLAFDNRLFLEASDGSIRNRRINCPAGVTAKGLLNTAAKLGAFPLGALAVGYR